MNKCTIDDKIDLSQYPIFSIIDVKLNKEFYINLPSIAYLSLDKSRIIFHTSARKIKICFFCKKHQYSYVVNLGSLLTRESLDVDSCKWCRSDKAQVWLRSYYKDPKNQHEIDLKNHATSLKNEQLRSSAWDANREEILSLYTKSFLSLKTIEKLYKYMQYPYIRDKIIESIGMSEYLRISKLVKIRSAKETGLKLSSNKKAAKIGKDHYRYYGAQNGYSDEFYLKRSVLITKDTTCLLCTSSKSLALHHIDRDKNNNRWDNLVSLCQSHHNQYHALAANKNGFFMGIDPGNTECGWAIINYKVNENEDRSDERIISASTVVPNTDMDLQSKQSYILDKIEKIAQIYLVDWVVIERPQLQGKAGVTMNMFLGKLEERLKNFKIFWVNPMTMKREFGIEKEDIKVNLQDYFGVDSLKDMDHNAIDAIGIAMCTPYNESMFDDIILSGSKIMTDRKRKRGEYGT